MQIPSNLASYDLVSLHLSSLRGNKTKPPALIYKERFIQNLKKDIEYENNICQKIFLQICFSPLMPSTALSEEASNALFEE